MDGRSATIAVLGVAVLGVVAFLVLDGITAGAVLVVAGIAMVVIGVVGWHDRSPALAGLGASPADASPDRSGDGRLVAEAAETRPAAAAAEPTRPALAQATSEAPRTDPGRGPGALRPVSDPPSEASAEAEAPASADDALEYAPGPEQPTMRLVADDADDLDHVHEAPLLGHGDLVAHVRDYHASIPQDGSTIQLRLLHEREHGAPHEPPVNLTTA